METEKIVAVLLIVAILFSVASIVFNISVSDLKPVKSYSPVANKVSGNQDGGIGLVIEGNPASEVAK